MQVISLDARINDSVTNDSLNDLIEKGVSFSAFHSQEYQDEQQQYDNYGKIFYDPNIFRDARFTGFPIPNLSVLTTAQTHSEMAMNPIFQTYVLPILP